jgi:hypothetical protein
MPLPREAVVLTPRLARELRRLERFGSVDVRPLRGGQFLLASFPGAAGERIHIVLDQDGRHVWGPHTSVGERRPVDESKLNPRLAKRIRALQRRQSASPRAVA